MKTVFEGIVNGQKFDNVADYNAALVEALKHGNVNASSQTKTVPDENIDDVITPTCCDETCHDYEEPDLFPGLDENEYYMDGMIGDDKEDEITYNNWKEYLENNYKQVVEWIGGFDVDDLETYLQDLKEAALDSIQEDKKTTEKALEQLVVEREDLKDRLQKCDLEINCLKNAGKLNTMFIQYYSQLITKLTAIVNEMQMQEKIQTSVTEVRPQIEANLDGIQKLLEEIFPGSFVRK